jgi:hypothetical protein
MISEEDIKRKIKAAIKESWRKTPRLTKAEFLSLVEAAWREQTQTEYDD